MRRPSYIHAVSGGDDPLVRDDAAAAPVTPVVTAVQHATLPRPRVRAGLHATHDTRVLGRHTTVTTDLLLHR